MDKKQKDVSRETETLISHGAGSLPSVTIDGYNLELKDGKGFLGDRASKSAFMEKLDDWRTRVRKGGDDPMGDISTKDLSKKQIDAFLVGDDKQAAGLVLGAIEDFAGELAHVLGRFLKDESWKGTERIAVGGGLKESQFGALAFGRATVMLKAEGFKIDLVPIAHHPDEAGLIGSAHLMPAWMLHGYDAILAVDIGGTNIRAGIVELKLEEKPDLSTTSVWKSELWRHADDAPKRRATVDYLVDMLKNLIRKAEKAKLSLAPVIGVACPGIINADGSIARGGQNLPGGNWESESFNLGRALTEAIPQIGNHETFVIIHNDAVIQGLSQVPFMQDVKKWGVVTIGTGLGNARFTNNEDKEKP